MDENLAGILGLLIGGAGGYYGGKKRSKREEDKLKMLLGITDEDDTSGENTTAAEVADEVVEAYQPSEGTTGTGGQIGSVPQGPFAIEQQAIDQARDARGLGLEDIGDIPESVREFFSPSSYFDDGQLLYDNPLSRMSDIFDEELMDARTDLLPENVNKLFRSIAGGIDYDSYEAEELRKQQPTREEMNILNQIIGSEYTDSGLLDKAMGSGDLPIGTDFSRPNSDRTVTRPDMMFIYDRDGNIKPEFLTAFSEMYPQGNDPFANELEGFNFSPEVMELLGLNQGGRVGLANGGLGYSYKNNIFSADPSTGIPAVVDAGGDDDTFINLFPGLFPPVTDPVETIIDTPAVPMGGGGGENNPYSDNYTGGYMGDNEGYETFGDLMLDINNLPNMFGKPDPTDPFSTAYTGLDNIGEEEENSFFGLNLPNFADLPTPTNTFFNKLGELRDFISNKITNPDPDKGDPDPKPGPKTPSVNSTGGAGDKQKKSGGGGGGSSPSPGKSKTGSAGPGGAGGRAKGGKYK